MKQSSKILAELPAYIGQIYKKYQGAINTILLFLGVIVGIKLTVVLISAVNDIPLLAPTFEAIGFGYTAWFVYRYLLHAATRDELNSKISEFKSEVFGQPE